MGVDLPIANYDKVSTLPDEAEYLKSIKTDDDKVILGMDENGNLFNLSGDVALYTLEMDE